MSIPPRQTQHANRNVPEDFMDDLIGFGFSYSDWEIRFRQRNYFWSEGMKNKMIEKEREYFKEEILRLSADENKAGKLKCKTNSLASILKRLQGEEWLKGTPDEREKRHDDRRLMGKDAKPRCLQSHFKRWKDEAASTGSSRVSPKVRAAVGSGSGPPVFDPNQDNTFFYSESRPTTAYGQAPTNLALENATPDLFNRVGMLLNHDQSTSYSHCSHDQTFGSSNQIIRTVFDSEQPAFVNQGMFPDIGPAPRKLSNTPIYDNMMSSQVHPQTPSVTQSHSWQTLEYAINLMDGPIQNSTVPGTDGEVNFADYINNEAYSTNQDIHFNPPLYHRAVQADEVLTLGSSTSAKGLSQFSLPVHHGSDTEMLDCDVLDDAALRGSNRNDRTRRRNPTSDQQLRNRNPIRARQVSKLKDELAVMEAELQRKMEQIQQLENEKNAALQEKETARISEAESRRAKEVAETKFQELQEQIKSSQNAVKRISRQLDDTVMADNLQLFQEITIAQAPPIRNKTPDEDNDSSHARHRYSSARNSGAVTLTAPNSNSSASQSPGPRGNTLTIRPTASRDRSHSGGSSAGFSDRSTLSVQDASGRDGSHNRGTISSETSTAVSFKQLRRKISDKFMGKTNQEHKNETAPPIPVSRPPTAVPSRGTEQQQRIPLSKQLTETQNRDSGYVSQVSPRASVADKE